MFAMSRQLKGALMAAGGGVCWGISGTMGQVSVYARGHADTC